MDELIDRLGALPTETEPGEDGWPAIRARIEPRRSPRTWWKQAAAAAVIFVAGLTGGFLAAKSEGVPSSSIDEALTLAAEVQRTGTEYVAALAAFSAVIDSLSADARTQGRDAAIATLFGAASELAAFGGDPGNPSDIHRVRF